MSHQAETALQKAVTQLLQVYENQGRLAWWPVPNGAYVWGGTKQDRAKRVQQMKQAGLLRSGVWDIGLCFPGGRLAILELKIGENVLSREQRDWGELMHKVGAKRGLARSVEDVQAFVSRCELEFGVRR